MTSRLVLAYAAREGGPVAVSRLLDHAGLAGREAELRDENRWFSFRTKIALFEAAGQVLGEERPGRSIGRAALDLDIGTGLKRVLRALGTPALVYRNIVRAAAKFTWTHRMTSLGVGDGVARIAYDDVSGTGYHRHDCDYNIGLLSAVPELFGLPEARIGHPECAVDGASRCVYEVRWNTSRRLTTWTPSAVSGAAAVASGVALAGVPEALPAAGVFAALATVLGVRAARDRTRSLEALTRRSGQRDEAADRLAVSMRELAADLRPDEVLGKIASHAQSAVGGKEFALLLAEDGMRCVRSSGIPDASVHALESWAAKPGTLAEQATIVDDVAFVPALRSLAHEPTMPLGSLCSAPLRFQGRLLGLLIALAHGPEAFLPHDADLLTSYAGQAAVALSNATLVERLERMAHEDALTGLANQRHFHRRMTEEGVRSERERTPLAVVVLDLDHFKRINDTHGHARGDEVLRAVGAALRGSVRPYDTVARLGGEEFAVILPGTAPEQAYALAERIRSAVARVQVEGVTLSCSAGVAGWPDDTSDLELLLRLADAALYAAKAAGRGRTRRYDGEALSGRDHDAADTAERIRTLLEDPAALQIVFQPVLTLATGQISGYEALARFPTFPGLRPDCVFAQAHEAGVGPELEALAIRRAIAEPGRPAGTVLGVNASLTALASPNLWAELPRDLAGVIVEITEHELYESDAQLRDILGRLRDRGARIAVDDVGAGYAGLQQLARVRPEVVKLDRALVDGVAADTGKAALIEAFVRFAAGTGAVVCAEGVEELADLSALAALDVTSAQGYAIARPAPAWASVAPAASAAVAGAGESGVREIGCRAGLGEQLDILQRLVRVGDRSAASAVIAESCGADHVAMLASDAALGPARRHVLESGVTGQVLRRDPAADATERARLGELGCSSLLLVPVVFDGRSVGLVEVGRRQEEPWSRVDAEHAQILARQLGPLMAPAPTLA